MLGAPKRTQHPLLERQTFWADLYQVCPDWWLESSEEQAPDVALGAGSLELT